MDFFISYVQPLIHWLHNHPHWALFFTFIVAFSESLAVVGNIVPGTVTMTGFGILAGTGVMRLDLTYFAAILGAIAGDSVSYTLGYFLSDKLYHLWPFRLYPSWLTRGKTYFQRHGGTSIFLGRFTGPLRAMIPLIAGMMRMKQVPFLFANILSAIGWSVLYITPGVLVGVAGSELSTKNASHLFIVILLSLASLWLFALGIHWLFIKAHQKLRKKFHQYWLIIMHHRLFGVLAKKITPNETNHARTATLLLACLCCIVFCIFFAYFDHSFPAIQQINWATYRFFQSIRNDSFDTFFIIIQIITSRLPTYLLIISISIYALYHRNWRFIRYFISLNLTAIGLSLLINAWLPITSVAHHQIKINTAPYFATHDVLLITSLFCFLVLNLHTKSIYYLTEKTLDWHPKITDLLLKWLFFILLLTTGFSLLYLGDNLLSTLLITYVIGLLNCLIYWLFYRKKSHSLAKTPILYSLFFLFVAFLLSFKLYFHPLTEKHLVHIQQYVITPHAWWHQKKPVLPHYTYNRFGKPVGFINIQYVGKLNTLKKVLLKEGWVVQKNSFSYTLLIRIAGASATTPPTPKTQLFMNNKPMLTMIYPATPSSPALVLRLWRSNFHLQSTKRAIWIASIQSIQKNKHPSNQPLNTFTAPFKLPTTDFRTKTISLSPPQLPYTYSTDLLLIKETHHASF